MKDTRTKRTGTTSSATAVTRITTPNDIERGALGCSLNTQFANGMKDVSNRLQSQITSIRLVKAAIPMVPCKRFAKPTTTLSDSKSQCERVGIARAQKMLVHGYLSKEEYDRIRDEWFERYYGPDIGPKKKSVYQRIKQGIKQWAKRTKRFGKNI